MKRFRLFGWENNGGSEKKIRKYLIDNNFVDCVIQLPDNLFFGTTIATCIMVLKKGKKQPDASLRDTENVPLAEDIDAYFAREVLPYAPDAWIDAKKTKVGYEIPMTRYFYEYTAPEAIESIIVQRLKEHPNAICSYSGGSDSDIMIDLIERARKMFLLPPVHYAFFNTGLELQATKDHVKATEKKYGVKITEYRPKASSTGLRITPPPMPQMQPITEAEKATKIKISSVIGLSPLSCNIHLSLYGVFDTNAREKPIAHCILTCEVL